MLDYENDLRKTLAKMKVVVDGLDKLKLEKEEMREAIKKFLKIHDLDEYEIKDTEKQLWRLTITQSERRSVDYDELEKLLSEEQLEDVVTISPSERLNIKPVKAYKKKNGKPAPKAPRANVKDVINKQLGEDNA